MLGLRQASIRENCADCINMRCLRIALGQVDIGTEFGKYVLLTSGRRRTDIPMPTLNTGIWQVV